MVVGEIITANTIPLMLAPKPKEDDKIDIQDKLNSVKIDNIHEITVELLDKIDLPGMQDWSPEQQQQAKDLISEYACVSSMNGMDLGKTSMVKHNI